MPGMNEWMKPACSNLLTPRTSLNLCLDWPGTSRLCSSWWVTDTVAVGCGTRFQSDWMRWWREGSLDSDWRRNCREREDWTRHSYHPPGQQDEQPITNQKSRSLKNHLDTETDHFKLCLMSRIKTMETRDRRQRHCNNKLHVSLVLLKS